MQHNEQYYSTRASDQVFDCQSRTNEASAGIQHSAGRTKCHSVFVVNNSDRLRGLTLQPPLICFHYVLWEGLDSCQFWLKAEARRLEGLWVTLRYERQQVRYGAKIQTTVEVFSAATNTQSSKRCESRRHLGKLEIALFAKHLCFSQGLNCLEKVCCFMIFDWLIIKWAKKSFRLTLAWLHVTFT